LSRSHYGAFTWTVDNSYFFIIKKCCVYVFIFSSCYSPSSICWIHYDIYHFFLFSLISNFVLCVYFSKFNFNMSIHCLSGETFRSSTVNFTYHYPFPNTIISLYTTCPFYSFRLINAFMLGYQFNHIIYLMFIVIGIGLYFILFII
jgi:hypothetical protein